jgi:hypothetical protein
MNKKAKTYLSMKHCIVFFRLGKPRVKVDEVFQCGSPSLSEKSDFRRLGLFLLVILVSLQIRAKCNAAYCYELPCTTSEKEQSKLFCFPGFISISVSFLTI